MVRSILQSNASYETIADDEQDSVTATRMPNGNAIPMEEWTKAMDNEEIAAKKLANDKYVMGVGYILSMGVCGIVLVALGSTLTDLAEHVGMSSTKIGSVFIARGFGAVLGAVCSSKLYVWFPGNRVMAFSLFCIAFLLVLLPVARSSLVLHIVFMLLGLGTAITDTGCQIMTRKLHGKEAGPWLGANTVSFGISGACVPLIEIITQNLEAEYFILAVIVMSISTLLAFGPDPEKGGRIQGGPMKRENTPVAPNYHVEFVVGLMVFFFIGGKVTSTAYLKTYCNETGIIAQNHESFLVFVLWIAITIGRLAGVLDQRTMTNQTLPSHLAILCVGGTLSMLLIILYPSSPEALWAGVAFYGLFNGPCVGYCYDWNNRITYPTEVSMSIVMFGLNFGASIVPYFTSLAWNNGCGPMTLIVVIFLSMILPLPLLYLSKYVSYDATVNPWMKHAYTSIPQADEMKP